jgi:hypothetical protein
MPEAGVTPETGGPQESGVDACAPAAPPSGFTLVDPGMDKGNGTSDRGLHTALAVDSDGSPLIAYERVIPGDGAADTSEVWFTRWDRSCGGRWVSPVKVDAMDHLTDSTRGVDIAYDASSGAIGIAYRAATYTLTPADSFYELRVATLAKGSTTFALSSAFGYHSSDPSAPAGPNSAAIAMANGTIWVAGTAGYVGTSCTSNCDGLVWSKTSADGGTWDAPTGIVVPNIVAYGVSLSVDSAGVPAIAYSHSDSSGGALAYQRLDGTGIDVVPGVSADSVDLTFDGTKPRLVGLMQQADFGTTGQALWFASSDDGVTWSAPVPVPNDQGDSLDQYPTIAVGPAGKIAVAAAINSSDGTRTYGTPKYSIATDLMSFATTGPAMMSGQSIDYTQWMRAAYGEGGKLQIAFYLSIPTSGYVTGQGLVFWRE